jgi:AcrR family transcriptional regulator
MSSEQPVSEGVSDRILAAARELAGKKPVDEIRLAEVARAAGVSWPTVKRHVGSRESLREKLLSERPELASKLRRTRDRLLDAAARVFVRTGYDRATMDEVAGEAGMTKGAVYWYFKSKLELFLALLDQYAASWSAEARWQNNPSEPAEGTALLASLLANPHSVFETSRDRIRLLLEFASHLDQPGVRERLATALRSRRRFAAEALSLAQSQGRLGADHDPVQLAAFWTAAAHGVELESLLDPDNVPPNAVRQAAVRAVWEGVAPASAIADRPPKKKINR